MIRSLQQFFLGFSGEDPYILAQTLPETRSTFAFLGGLVLFILIISFGAWIIFFKDFLEIKIADILYWEVVLIVSLASILTWVFFNIYLLTLYTLSLPLLPFQQSNESRFLDLSVRYLFICFLGLITAIPYGLELFEDSVALNLKEWKLEKSKEFELQANLILGPEIAKIDEWIAKMESEPGGGNPALIENMKIRSSRMKQDILLHNEKMEEAISKSNFYFQRISLLFGRQPLFMLLLIFSIFLFLMPAIFKAVVSDQIDYYQIKQIIEKAMIEEEYKLFKQRYANLIYPYSAERRDWVEHCEDPPYNTILKKRNKPSLRTQDELYKRLKNG